MTCVTEKSKQAPTSQTQDKIDGIKRKVEINMRKFVTMIKSRQRIMEGMTDSNIAKLTGLPKSIIKAIKDRTHEPSMAEFAKICYALDITPIINFWKEEELNNRNTEIEVVLLKGAQMPEAMREGDAAADLYAYEDITIPGCTAQAPGNSKVRTGIKLKIPSYLAGIIKARSGSSINSCIEVGAGLIDSNYTGEIIVNLYNFSHEDFVIKKGHRIAQIVFVHKATAAFKKVDKLPETNRGDKGFGSSGK